MVTTELPDVEERVREVSVMTEEAKSESSQDPQLLIPETHIKLEYGLSPEINKEELIQKYKQTEVVIGKRPDE